MPHAALANPANFAIVSGRDVRRIARHAPAADAARFLHPAQQALLHQRGWLTMLAPRSAGGAELPLPQVVRLEEAVAAIDGSMGWVLTLCAGAGWFAGFLEPELAKTIIGTPRACLGGYGFRDFDRVPRFSASVALAKAPAAPPQLVALPVWIAALLALAAALMMRIRTR